MWKILGYADSQAWEIDHLNKEDYEIVLSPLIGIKILEESHGGYLEYWSDGELVQDWLIYNSKSDNFEVKEQVKNFINQTTIA